jgi:PAS domain S-box-containing protein
METSVSERALVLVDSRQDTNAAAQALRAEGFITELCAGVTELLEAMQRGAGFALVSDNGLDGSDTQPLKDWLARQPEWSDFPFILLTQRGTGPEPGGAMRFLPVLGNVTFLETPFLATTLISLAQSALRGRRRQYEARARLEQLREQGQVLETLNRTGADLAALLVRDEAVQRVTDAGVEITGAEFGAFFHNVIDERGESYMLYTLSGVDRSAFERFPMPRATQVFKPTFEGSAVIRSDDITRDPRYGHNAPHKGMPEGHLPVCSYLAVPVMSRTGEVAGGLFFGHSKPGQFTERHEMMITGLAGQAAIALDNAGLFLAAQRELDRRRETERALQASNNRFRAAIDAVQGTLWTTDPDGRMVGDQPGWQALTGQTPEEYLNGGWAAVVHPDDLGPTTEAWRRAVEARRTFMFESRVRRHDGSWRNYAIRAVPILDDEGGVIQWVGIHTDITAQRAAENALITLNATLESRVRAEVAEREEAQSQLRQAQKMDAIGQLTGGIAHDFNNLLTPIVGSLDMLRLRLKEDERAQRTINMALQATARATTLVQRLLAFARRQDLQPRAVDVGTLLAGMEELLSRSLGAQIGVEVEAAPELPAAQVDPNQLELAVLNLALNGRDAMPEGGTIRIVTDQMVLDASDRDLAAGRYVRITVSDNGAGMDEEVLQRATEPFFSTKGLGKGTGLGVSMVHGLAAQSGGALRLASKPGEGTRAEIWLPAAAAPEAVTLPPPPPPSVSHDGGTVLLVDDEDIVRTGTAEMLGDFGYTVLQAASGAEALAMLRAQGGEVDVLVTDFLMPGMNGAMLAQEAHQIHPELPVLLITGYSTLAEGPGAHLPRLNKPFRQSSLANQIARLMKRNVTV